MRLWCLALSEEKGHPVRTREGALKARDIMIRHLAEPMWLRGVGVTLDDKGGYAVQVNVQSITPEILATVPNHIHLQPVTHPHGPSDDAYGGRSGCGRRCAAMNKPCCWMCGSSNVTVKFIGYVPTFHIKDECDCPDDGRTSCGETAQGRCVCHACLNTWVDGDISEFDLGLN